MDPWANMRVLVFTLKAKRGDERKAEVRPDPCLTGAPQCGRAIGLRDRRKTLLASPGPGKQVFLSKGKPSSAMLTAAHRTRKLEGGRIPSTWGCRHTQHA